MERVIFCLAIEMRIYKRQESSGFTPRRVKSSSIMPICRFDLPPITKSPQPFLIAGFLQAHKYSYAGLKLKNGLINFPIKPVTFTGASATEMHKQS